MAPQSLRRLAPIAFVAVTALLPDGARATDPPIAAPGQQVPPHAAGGWPTALTDDDAKPTRTPEQQAHLDSVAHELKRIANNHGPDSVVLQSKFLIRSMGAGALGPVEVKVAGPSAAIADHLEIDVETGLFFDEKTTTLESRQDTVWKDIAIPVLDEMASFQIEPMQLEVVFLYDVQDVSAGADSSFDVSGPTTHEAFRVRMSRAVLDDLITNTVAGEALREKASVAQDAPVLRNAE